MSDKRGAERSTTPTFSGERRFIQFVMLIQARTIALVMDNWASGDAGPAVAHWVRLVVVGPCMNDESDAR